MRFVDDGAAGGGVDVEGGHDAGEHVVVADNEQRLDYLTGREALAQGREGVVVDAWLLEYFMGEAQQGAFEGGLQVAALYGGDLFIIDTDCS